MCVCVFASENPLVIPQFWQVALLVLLGASCCQAFFCIENSICITICQAPQGQWEQFLHSQLEILPFLSDVFGCDCHDLCEGVSRLNGG